MSFAISKAQNILLSEEKVIVTDPSAWDFAESCKTLVLSTRSAITPQSNSRWTYEKIFNDVYNTASVRHAGLIQMVEVNLSINILDKSYPYPRYY